MNIYEKNSLYFDDENSEDIVVSQGLINFYLEYANAILRRDNVKISNANNPRILLIALKKGDEEAAALVHDFYRDVIQRGIGWFAKIIGALLAGL